MYYCYLDIAQIGDNERKEESRLRTNWGFIYRQEEGILEDSPCLLSRGPRHNMRRRPCRDCVLHFLLGRGLRYGGDGETQHSHYDFAAFRGTSET